MCNGSVQNIRGYDLARGPVRVSRVIRLGTNAIGHSETPYEPI